MASYLVEDAKVAETEAEVNEKVRDRIAEVMRLVFLAVKDRLDKKFGVFEIFGFDFMLDKALQPYLLEININPALFLDT